MYDEVSKGYYYKNYNFYGKFFGAFFCKGHLELDYNLGVRKKHVLIPLELYGEELNKVLLHEIEKFKKEVMKND